MAAELWDLYDAHGKPLGRTMTRGEDVPAGCYHIAVHIWPINSRGEFLIQKRSADVQWKPNLWAITGGSAISGETAVKAAIRELAEEIGYQANENEMHRIACLRRTNSFCHVFTLPIDCAADSFVLQKEEVSAVQWCNPRKLSRMVSEGMFYNYGDAYFRMIYDYARRQNGAGPR